MKASPAMAAAHSAIFFSSVAGFAASGPSIMVQSITTLCELTPDHSTKATAMRRCRPAVIASNTRLSAMAAASDG